MTPWRCFVRSAFVSVAFSLLVITVSAKSEGRSSGDTETNLTSQGTAYLDPHSVAGHRPVDSSAATREQAARPWNDSSGLSSPLPFTGNLGSHGGSRSKGHEDEEAPRLVHQLESPRVAGTPTTDKQLRLDVTKSGEHLGVGTRFVPSVGYPLPLEEGKFEQGKLDDAPLEPSHRGPVDERHSRQLPGNAVGAQVARQSSAELHSLSSSSPSSDTRVGENKGSEFSTDTVKSSPATAVPVATGLATVKRRAGGGGFSTTALLARRTLEEVGGLGRGIGLYLYGIVFRGNLLMQKHVLDKIKGNLSVLEFVEQCQPQFASSHRALLDELYVWQDTLQRVTQREQALVLQHQAQKTARQRWARAQAKEVSGAQPSAGPELGSQAPPERTHITENVLPETAAHAGEQEPLEEPRNENMTNSRGPGIPGSSTLGAGRRPALVPPDAGEQFNAPEVQPSSTTSLTQPGEDGRDRESTFPRGKAKEEPRRTPSFRGALVSSVPSPATRHQESEGVLDAAGPEKSEVVPASHFSVVGPDLAGMHPETEKMSSDMDFEVADVALFEPASDGPEAVRHDSEFQDGTLGLPALADERVAGPLTPPSVQGSAGVPPNPALDKNDDNVSADTPANRLHTNSVTVGQHDVSTLEGKGTGSSTDGLVSPTAEQSEKLVLAALGATSGDSTASWPAGSADGAPTNEAVAQQTATDIQEASHRSPGQSGPAQLPTSEWNDIEPGLGQAMHGQQSSEFQSLDDEVDTLDLYLSLLQSTFFKCGALLSRALLADDSKELTWFYQQVLPNEMYLARISVALLTSQYRRGVRTAASTERQLQKVRSMMFHVLVVDEAFLNAIYAKDEPAVSDRLKESEPDEYRKPNARTKTQKTKKDKGRIEGTRVGAVIEFAKAHLGKPWVVGILTFASLVGLDHYGYRRYYY